MNERDWRALQALKRAKKARKVAWRRVPLEQIATEPALRVACLAHGAAVGVACRLSPRLVCASRCEHAAHVAPPDFAEVAS